MKEKSMRFRVTYRTLSGSQQTGPSADVSANDEETIELEAADAGAAAQAIQRQPGRAPGGIDVLSIQPIEEPAA